jgi:glycosyltransferase involved in cell wall biosynthesis
MKILFVADGHSPIALNWIEHFIQPGYEVHLASSFPCKAVDGLASLAILPLPMRGMDKGGSRSASGRLLRSIMPVMLRTLVRNRSVPYALPRAAEYLAGVINSIQPDLIHAMRIPFEGMLASSAIQGSINRPSSRKAPPLLISVWGNDFTLHARSTRPMYDLTCRAMASANALHTDCQRDQRLAVEFGFYASKPKIVLPGGGGVQTDIFYPSPSAEQVGFGANPRDLPVTVINPRGFRTYVRNDTFFKAIPLVLEKHPQVRFVCPAMAGEAQAEKWVAELKIGHVVDLLPPQSRLQMADLFRRAEVMVSITTHDGTPNTLLEALACGCFPIAGDIESLREWINPGQNGLLVDPGDPQALAGAILTAIADPQLRRLAQVQNLPMVRERAEFQRVMQQAGEFYSQLLAS